MAKKPETSDTFDYTKFMFNFDASTFTEEMTKAFSSHKFPNVDADKIVESQRKNIEAVAAANKLAAEGIQSIYARQAEIFRQSMEELGQFAGQITDTKDPRDAAIKNAEVVKAAYEKALFNMRELAEIASNANEEAAETINARISETLEEIRDLAVKLKI